MTVPPISRADPALRAIFALAEHLTSGSKIPEESRELLARALHESIASEFQISLHAALGLKSWGGSSPFRKIGLSRRDRMLRRLRRSVDEWADLSPAAAARAMVASATRYETDRWPRERYSVGGPATKPYSVWWGFLRAGILVPGERQLATILKMEIQDGFEFPLLAVNVPRKGADHESNPDSRPEPLG